MKPIKLQDGELVLPDSEQAASRYIRDLFLNNGRIPDEDDVQVKWNDMYRLMSPRLRDTVATPDIRPLLQTSMEMLIREPVEPLMVITNLFNRVQAQGLSQQVLAGAMGAFTADDIPEGGTYPEVMIQIGGALQTVYIGKSGLAASFTDEALRYSTWDLMSLLMRQIGAALVRHKERKAVAFLKTLGTTLMDNAAPTDSLLGVTTGRGLGGAANGSLRMEDLFKCMAHMSEEGFHPDILIMNPQFFYLFIQDPVLQAMMLAHGGGAWFRPWNGQPGPQDPWSNGAMGSRGPSLGNKIVPGGSPSGASATGIAGREHGMTSTPPIPSPYFPWPFRIVVSPFMTYDAETQLGDLILASSGNIGHHLVDETPTSVEWRDESVDIVKFKVRERYGFNVAHEGQAVGLIKNLKLTRNYWDGTVSFNSMDIDSEIAPDESITL